MNHIHDDDEARLIRLHEERLHVSRETDAFEARSVDVRVVTETITQRVATAYETIDISAHDVSAELRVADPIVAPVALTVRLSREDAFVGKRTVVTENVTIGRRRETETIRTRATLRREELDVTFLSDIPTRNEDAR